MEIFSRRPRPPFETRRPDFFRTKSVLRGQILYAGNSQAIPKPRRGNRTRVCFLSARKLAKRAGRRIRTDDLLITNQLLYQLSYAGKKNAQSLAHARVSNKLGHRRR